MDRPTKTRSAVADGAENNNGWYRAFIWKGPKEEEDVMMWFLLQTIDS